MSIYCWALGEIALARICKKVFAKVRISKNEDGIFHDTKVLAITANEDGTTNATKELCYYVEICHSSHKLWLPYTSLRLAERCRPFYGPRDRAPVTVKAPTVVRKRKLQEDHTLPLSVAKLAKAKTQDLNATFDFRQLPMRQGKYENAYKEFLRRGKDMVFDEFFFLLKRDLTRSEDLDYLLNVDASTEDKFETVMKNIMTAKEVKNYLQQCWRFNSLNRETVTVGYSQAQHDSPDHSSSSSPTKAVITVHANWCLVCGKRDHLQPCPDCPASFHVDCRQTWTTTIMHRKSLPKQPQSSSTSTVTKVLSSTRTVRTVTTKRTDGPELCPSCTWGPVVGYGDVVWHKLGSCPWWPAQVLSPGSLPSCLVTRKHEAQQWPVKYYAEDKYSWGDGARMCLFLPSHTAALDEDRSPDLQQAVLDACDHYIQLYLT